MESPLSGENNGYCHDCNVFVGDESFAPAVAKAGFDALSLATNHTGDAYGQGYLNTIRVLREQGIVPFGAGADLAEALRPAIIEVKGIRVAFIGNNDVPSSCCHATETQLGHVQFGHDDPGYPVLREQIAAAKKVADIVIVMSSLGWPSEYQESALPGTIAAARAMIDAGATAILGGQPHWVQGVEARAGTYIAYAMGNFIQDQMGRTVGFPTDQTREGSIHRLYFDGTRLASVSILPTWLENYHQPRFPSPDEPQYRRALEQIWRNSIFGD
jgi:poly-gamma-glutamate synthesis protein (capsule biosynthesis protein)